jgi:hypothetical protein
MLYRSNKKYTFIEQCEGNGVRVIVLNATFNSISVISRQSVLLVEETGVHGENHRPVACHWQTLSCNVVSSTPHLSGVQTHKKCLVWFKLNVYYIFLFTFDL